MSNLSLSDFQNTLDQYYADIQNDLTALPENAVEKNALIVRNYVDLVTPYTLWTSLAKDKLSDKCHIEIINDDLIEELDEGQPHILLAEQFKQTVFDVMSVHERSALLQLAAQYTPKIRKLKDHIRKSIVQRTPVFSTALIAGFEASSVVGMRHLADIAKHLQIPHEKAQYPHLHMTVDGNEGGHGEIMSKMAVETFNRDLSPKKAKELEAGIELVAQALRLVLV